MKDKYNIIEWCIIALVFSTTISLYSYQNDVESQPLELTSITGNIKLSTRTSMDMFGLENFKTGANARINLTNAPIEAVECHICDYDIVGIILTGTVIITELFDSENRQGRVEGELNVTHLVERSGNYINHEWVFFNWSAGDVTSTWDMVINHNPPRWLPKFASEAIFIETKLGLQSRSGPEILIQNTAENTKLIQACLPDSFLCKQSSPDAILVANFNEDVEPVLISSPARWSPHNISDLPPVVGSFELIDNVFERGKGELNVEGFLPPDHGTIDNASTYNLIQSNNNLAPLSLWFTALELTPLSINLAGQSLIHMSNSTINFYNIVSHDGQYTIGLSIS